MQKKDHGRITSWEISRFMLKHGAPLSSKEVSRAMKTLHPHLEVNPRDVYMRMKALAQSKHSTCQVNDTVRPRTFHLSYLSDEFFRGSRAPNRMSVEQRGEMKKSVHDKEEDAHKAVVERQRLLNALLYGTIP